MGKVIDLVGRRFGRLVVLRYVCQDLWLCRCRCGQTAVVRGGNLKSANTKSCGCWRRETMAARQTRHGQSRSPEYRAWQMLKDRCCNPGNPDYSRYGGRGIRVCDSWLHAFEQFRADVGPRPSRDRVLGRIDPDGHYEPGNVRWGTRSEQARTQRPSAARQGALAVGAIWPPEDILPQAGSRGCSAS